MKFFTLPHLLAFLSGAVMVLRGTDADAYLGPGAGLGMLGSLIAIVVAVVVLFLGLLIYPLRRLRRGKKT